jgi:hypothetical protein
MSDPVNIYCDESCHLEHDGQGVMVLGAVWCPRSKVREIARRLREIKMAHGMPPTFEVKWTKVSQGKWRLYQQWLDYFFDDDDLHFRALIVPDKSQLDHQAFGQDHDTWYYKMYFDMLKLLLSPKGSYNIYLDIKDTCSAAKIHRLHQVLCNSKYDFRRKIVERVQAVRSHEVEQVQLADLLIGIVSYANRGLTTSEAKVALVRRMRVRSQYNLTRSTLLREDKVNILRWQASEPD